MMNFLHMQIKIQKIKVKEGKGGKYFQMYYVIGRGTHIYPIRLP